MCSLQRDRSGDPAAGMSERVATIRPQFVDEIGAFAVGLRAPAGELLDAVATSNWALEWCLADWIGQAYGLADGTVESLRLTNVQMIAFARLIDDLADGESRFPPTVATPLAVTLQRVWTAGYLRLLRGSAHEDRFWSRFDRHLGRWMAATQSAPTGGTGVADRAAFLDVAVAAGCLVAGRPDVLAELELAMGDLAVGIVMLDDLFDWRLDLAGDRANVFVDHVWAGPLDGAPRDAIARAVQRELYVGAGHSYLDALLVRLDEARRRACVAGCDGLARFIEWYAAESVAVGRHLVERALTGRALFQELTEPTSISSQRAARATSADNTKGDNHAQGATCRP
jgi:hypothetical protein